MDNIFIQEQAFAINDPLLRNFRTSAPYQSQRYHADIQHDQIPCSSIAVMMDNGLGANATANDIRMTAKHFTRLFEEVIEFFQARIAKCEPLPPIESPWMHLVTHLIVKCQRGWDDETALRYVIRFHNGFQKAVKSDEAAHKMRPQLYKLIKHDILGRSLSGADATGDAPIDDFDENGSVSPFRFGGRVEELAASRSTEQLERAKGPVAQATVPQQTRPRAAQQQASQLPAAQIQTKQPQAQQNQASSEPAGGAHRNQHASTVTRHKNTPFDASYSSDFTRLDSGSSTSHEQPPKTSAAQASSENPSWVPPSQRAKNVPPSAPVAVMAYSSALSDSTRIMMKQQSLPATISSKTVSLQKAPSKNTPVVPLRKDSPTKPGSSQAQTVSLAREQKSEVQRRKDSPVEPETPSDQGIDPVHERTTPVSPSEHSPAEAESPQVHSVNPAKLQKKTSTANKKRDELPVLGSNDTSSARTRSRNQRSTTR